MKKLFTLTLALCIALAAFAQPQGRQGRKGDRPDFEKIKAEKVAFITSEIGLTAKEAEAFWPVYNKIEEEQLALNKAERDAFRALNKAISEGQDTDALLDTYLKAKEANVNLHAKAVKDYRKVLPADKVAKFYTCEEKFLRKQLGELRGGHGAPGGDKGQMHEGHRGPDQGGQRPEGGRRGSKAPKGDKSAEGATI